MNSGGGAIYLFLPILEVSTTEARAPCIEAENISGPAISEPLQHTEREKYSHDMCELGQYRLFPGYYQHLVMLQASFVYCRSRYLRCGLEHAVSW